MRIKDEIRYLHSKNQRINQQLDEAHLLITHKRDWPHIQNEIEKRLHKEISSRYKNLNKKLHNLSQSQTHTPQEKLTFYPRVVNNTTITFSDNEMSLLQKGPKYNLHAKGHSWIQNLALEAETAITKLPANERESYRRIVADRVRTLQKKRHHHTKDSP
jgi:DNA-binding ferritin-like protein (Dps family)